MLAWPHAVGQNSLEMGGCGTELGSLEGERKRVGGSPESGRREKEARKKLLRTYMVIYFLLQEVPFPGTSTYINKPVSAFCLSGWLVGFVSFCQLDIS